jgi:hypothetical protein
MKTASKFCKCLDYILAVLLFTAVMLSTAASQTAPSASSKTQLMFVQSADDLKVDPAKSTFRLVKVNQQTLYFSDRPERIAGHMKMDQYLAEWSKAEGPDNFSSDPPNAILSVYESGKDDNSIVVVKISHPVVDGNDILYSYKIIKGTMPGSGGATALFIDSIGVGGGVGAGYHGVGVGGRGAGVR